MICMLVNISTFLSTEKKNCKPHFCATGNLVTHILIVSISWHGSPCSFRHEKMDLNCCNLSFSLSLSSYGNLTIKPSYTLVFCIICLVIHDYEWRTVKLTNRVNNHSTCQLRGARTHLMKDCFSASHD